MEQNNLNFPLVSNISERHTNIVNNGHSVYHHNPPQSQSQVNPGLTPFDISSIYFKKIDQIIQTLNENETSEEDTLRKEKKFDELIKEFEKLILDNCVDRIYDTHVLNLRLISKLSQKNYDFTRGRRNSTYENIITNIKDKFKQNTFK